VRELVEHSGIWLAPRGVSAHKRQGVGNLKRKTLAPLIATWLLSLSAITLAANTDSGPLARDVYRQEALTLLQESVAYRSVAGQGQVPALVAHLAQWFLAHGFSASEVHHIPVEPDIDALVVRYAGNGSGGPPILLMAHLDVVDASAKDWQTNPFELREDDGYLYGRGAMDNKSAAVTLATTFSRLRGEGYTPNRDLIILFSGDEETNALSIRHVLQQHHDLVDAGFALNSDAGGGYQDAHGRPAEFRIQAAEKSYMDFILTVRNPGGHSSRPRDDNAIYQLSDALQRLQAHRFPLRSNDITRGYFAAAAGMETGEKADAMRRFAADPTDTGAAEVLWHIPDLVGLTRTTCIATMLNAGHAPNALPQSAAATVNCRVFPGRTVAEAQAALAAVIDDPQVEITVLGEPRSSEASPLLPEVMSTLQRVVAQRYGEVPVIPVMHNAATDGVETRIAGIPTYGIGSVMHGVDDFRSHGQHERISKANFFEALEYWYVLLKEFSGAES
jgi:acetylornithine deacetylase/succinyl-diaminopimelate desuccinylase-like protein